MSASLSPIRCGYVRESGNRAPIRFNRAKPRVLSNTFVFGMPSVLTEMHRMLVVQLFSRQHTSEVRDICANMLGMLCRMHGIHYGIPDIFITSVSNPQWTEMRHELFIGQSRVDRRDITARVIEKKIKIAHGFHVKTSRVRPRHGVGYIQSSGRNADYHVHTSSLGWYTEKIRPVLK